MKHILVVLFSLLFLHLNSQENKRRIEILELGHRMVSGHGSEAGFKSWDIKANLFRIMFKKNKDAFITAGLNYRQANIDIKLDNPVFEDIQKFHSIGLNMVYIRKLNSNWGLFSLMSPRLNSNFTSNLQVDDFYLNIIALANYSRTKNSRLSFGLMYSNTIGLPFPVPVATYWKRLNSYWDFSLGFPRSYIRYTSTKQSELYFQFEYEGYKANLSKNITHPDFSRNKIAEQIRYSDFITGIEWVQPVNKFLFKLNTGYTLGRRFKLQDASREDVYEFDLKNNLSLGASVSFVIN